MLLLPSRPHRLHSTQPTWHTPHLALLAMLRPTVHVNRYLGGTLKGSPSAAACCPPPLRPGGGSGGSMAGLAPAGGSPATPACCRPLSGLPGCRPRCCAGCGAAACGCIACCCAACCCAADAAASASATGGAGWPSGRAARLAVLDDRLRVRPGVMAVGISSRSWANSVLSNVSAWRGWQGDREWADETCGGGDQPLVGGSGKHAGSTAGHQNLLVEQFAMPHADWVGSHAAGVQSSHSKGLPSGAATAHKHLRAAGSAGASAPRLLPLEQSEHIFVSRLQGFERSNGYFRCQCW